MVNRERKHGEHSHKARARARCRKEVKRRGVYVRNGACTRHVSEEGDRRLNECLVQKLFRLLTADGLMTQPTNKLNTAIH
jgi:hypothetical protein